MKAAICTLFEGKYHLGLAALVNSLYAHGYRGDVHAGYRGALPPWAKLPEGGTMMEVNDLIRIHFISLSTDYHLTNYKPDFMLSLWSGPATDADCLFYFDPDIIVNLTWSSFEKWIDCGVALCEDINSPVSENHPIRCGWRNYFKSYGMNLRFKQSLYVNGGFVGLKKSNIAFLEEWKRIQEAMADAIGGLSRSSLAGEKLDKESSGVFAPFAKTDQDALNATIEASDIPVSIVGREAMGFVSGRTLLPHALGQPKPWDQVFLSRSLMGKAPRVVDRLYWNHVSSPIKLFSSQLVARRKAAAGFASFTGRFYRRR